MAASAADSSSLSLIYASILERYTAARQTLAFAGNHEIRQLFAAARERLQSSGEISGNPHLKVVSSYGKGNWAAIPWISVLDDRETGTTQDGVYVVYLFREGGAGMYLKLAQGVTKLEQEMGVRAGPVLAQRADKIRGLVRHLGDQGFDLTGKSDLGTDVKAGRLYEASTIASRYYPATEIPNDRQLLMDLHFMLVAYGQYVESEQRNAGIRPKKAALVGTWKGFPTHYTRVKKLIEVQGGWPSHWSFGLKEGAQELLTPPFYLYINGGGGQIVGRARVDEIATERGTEGLISPWPEITQPEWVGVKRFGERQHEVNKTWLKFGALEALRPFRASELDLVPGLSTPNNLLNQNSFGYAYEKDDLTMEEVDVLAPEPVLEEEEVATRLGLDWLEDETLLEGNLLQSMVDALLNTSPQILLAGPPGTSKTWVAMKLAQFIAQGRSHAIRTVQFHPSYTYESFIEGLRPVSGQSGVSFELMPGAVLETVNEMRLRGDLDRMDRPYVMILDEANRANLPRVLGELLFLFEYRNEKVKLQYSGDFMLPKNLYFIGTMNTADRSIRAIDSALRRRFDVFELGANPVVLGKYLTSNGTGDHGLEAGLSALNEALTHQLDRHHTIGHAFFMRQNLDAASLASIWDRRIYPLIEEYFFDQPEVAREFTLARFWPNYGS